MKILIIGYGNPSRQDDGVGHYVVNRLNERFGLPTYDLLGEPRDDGGDTVRYPDRQIRTMWLQQLDVGLAEEVAEVDRLLLIDAHVGGAARVAVEVAGGDHVGVTSHVATPDTLVEIAEAAYGNRPRATRYSIRGERFDFGAELSEPVRAQAEALVAELLRDLTDA